jgi:hypothetical protein
MINSIREFLDKPIPSDLAGIRQWVDEINEYTQRVGDIKAIAELAECDVLDGENPMSSNPIYMAAYTVAKQVHSIEVEVNP